MWEHLLQNGATRYLDCQDFEGMWFCAVVEQLKEVPVHVHCIANYRVSAFFYRYRRDVPHTGTRRTCSGSCSLNVVRASNLTAAS
jgi:hypothetical protein